MKNLGKVSVLLVLALTLILLGRRSGLTHG